MHLNPHSQRRRRKADPVGEPPPEPEFVHRHLIVWATGPEGPNPHTAADAVQVESGIRPSSTNETDT